MAAPGLKPVRRQLADGKVKTYWYHRATGARLVHDPSTPAGAAEVARLDAQAAQVAQAEQANRRDGSFAALWCEYRQSPDWAKLAPRTRDDYQAVRDFIGAAASRMRVADVTREQLIRLRDAAAARRGRRFGNYVVQVIRLTFEWGSDRGWLGEGRERRPNPAMGMKLITRPAGAPKVNRAWTAGEVRAFAEGAPLQLFVPFALGLFAAMREGDALRVTWADFDGDTIRWRAGKNGEPCEAPVTGTMRKVLDAAAIRRAAQTARERGAYPQIALSTTGEPWSQAGFRASFFRRIRTLVAAGALQPGCTFHGLRSTVASIAREGGASDFQVAAAIGDRSTAMAALYGRDANRRAAQTEVLRQVQEKFGASVKAGDQA